MEFFTTYFLIGGLICAALGGYIAGEKNRNGMAWAILCFFTNIAGLIALVAIPYLPTFEETLKKEFPQANVHVSKPQWDARQGWLIGDTSFLVVNFEQKEIVVGLWKALKKPPKSFGEVLEKPHKEPYRMSFPFSSIVKVEVFRDETHAGKVIHEQVLGGGYVSKDILNGARYIVIRITVDSPDSPTHDVTFYVAVDKGGKEQGNTDFDQAAQKVVEFKGYLDTAIRDGKKVKEKQPENNSLENNQNVDVSEQLSRLWQLKQEGALTQEEFEKQKAKLLQS